MHPRSHFVPERSAVQCEVVTRTHVVLLTLGLLYLWLRVIDGCLERLAQKRLVFQVKCMET